MISKRFTPRYLKSIHGDIERIGKEIVDQLLRKSGPGQWGECDFVREVSAPLPIAVIAWLLGVPESDWNLLFDWTNRTIGAGDPEYQQPGKTPQETAMAAMTELFGYFAKLVEEKRKKPGDDLISLFAHLEVDGERIPEIDVLTFCLIIVIAGNETTRNGTTGGMLAFIEHPDEMRKLVRNPRLIDSAVEEVVRWTSPIIHFGRTATRRLRAARQADQGRPGARALLSVGQPRRGDLPGRRRVPRRPQSEPPPRLRRRRALLPRLARRAARAGDRLQVPAAAHRGDRGLRQDRAARSCLVGGVKRLPIRYKLTAE